MEPDCPPYLNTFRGIEDGTVPLLQLLAEENVKATFFTTGQAARDYPEKIHKIVSQGHELGCHGDTHKVFTKMDYQTAQAEIQLSLQTLLRFAPVTAFRAPNLKFPDKYLTILEAAGFLVDSSQAKYKIDYYRKPCVTTLQRIPVSVTSSFLRLPRWIRIPCLKQLTSPVVLFVHPWEFIDLRQERLRLDCRFRTGTMALDCIRSVIRFFKRKSAGFFKMGELL